MANSKQFESSIKEYLEQNPFINIDIIRADLLLFQAEELPNMLLGTSSKTPLTPIQEIFLEYVKSQKTKDGKEVSVINTSVVSDFMLDFSMVVTTIQKVDRYEDVLAIDKDLLKNHLEIDGKFEIIEKWAQDKTLPLLPDPTQMALIKLYRHAQVDHRAWIGKDAFKSYVNRYIDQAETALQDTKSDMGKRLAMSYINRNVDEEHGKFSGSPNTIKSDTDKLYKSYKKTTENRSIVLDKECKEHAKYYLGKTKSQIDEEHELHAIGFENISDEEREAKQEAIQKRFKPLINAERKENDDRFKTFEKNAKVTGLEWSIIHDNFFDEQNNTDADYVYQNTRFKEYCDVLGISKKELEDELAKQKDVNNSTIWDLTKDEANKKKYKNLFKVKEKDRMPFNAPGVPDAIRNIILRKSEYAINFNSNKAIKEELYGKKDKKSPKDCGMIDELRSVLQNNSGADFGTNKRANESIDEFIGDIENLAKRDVPNMVFLMMNANVGKIDEDSPDQLLALLTAGNFDQNIVEYTQILHEKYSGKTENGPCIDFNKQVMRDGKIQNLTVGDYIAEFMIRTGTLHAKAYMREVVKNKNAGQFFDKKTVKDKVNENVKGNEKPKSKLPKITKSPYRALSGAMKMMNQLAQMMCQSFQKSIGAGGFYQGLSQAEFDKMNGYGQNLDKRAEDAAAFIDDALSKNTSAIASLYKTLNIDEGLDEQVKKDELLNQIDNNPEAIEKAFKTIGQHKEFETWKMDRELQNDPTKLNQEQIDQLIKMVKHDSSELEMSEEDRKAGAIQKQAMLKHIKKVDKNDIDEVLEKYNTQAEFQNLCRLNELLGVTSLVELGKKVKDTTVSTEEKKYIAHDIDLHASRANAMHELKGRIASYDDEGYKKKYGDDAGEKYAGKKAMKEAVGDAMIGAEAIAAGKAERPRGEYCDFKDASGNMISRLDIINPQDSVKQIIQDMKNNSGDLTVILSKLKTFSGQTLQVSDVANLKKYITSIDLKNNVPDWQDFMENYHQHLIEIHKNINKDKTNA